jgi:hypothetical protein
MTAWSQIIDGLIVDATSSARLDIPREVRTDFDPLCRKIPLAALT